jgi:hypothetical protein
MNRFLIFVLRAILGVIFAVVLSRFFYPEAGIVFIAGMAVGLVGLAYVTEYYRKQRAEGRGKVPD